jgi:hypothetical protein
MLMLIGGYGLFLVRVFGAKEVGKEVGKHRMSLTRRGAYSNDRKRIAKDKLVIQKYLNMVQAVLSKLHAGEHVHVGHVTVEFFQLKFDVRFGHDLHFLDTKDPGYLAKFAEPAAPARPETEF